MSSRGKSGGPPLLLGVAAAAAYASSFSGRFVLDDFSSIPDNPTIRHLSDLGQVLAPLRGGGLTVDGRPVLNLSFAINYALGGAGIRGYHAVNLAVQVLAGLTLFGVLRRVSGRTGLAWAAALIWTVHPLCTEAVTYVVQRAESLMGLFYLAVIYGFVRYAEGAERSQRFGLERQAGSSRFHDETPGAFRSAVLWPSWAGFSVVCCWLGMGTKEVMVSAPITVLLIDRLWFAGSFAAAWRQRKGYYCGLAASWLLLSYLVWQTGSRGQTSGFGSGVSAVQYWLTQPGVIWHYLKLAVWPAPLVFDYGAEWISRPADVIGPAIGVAALAAAALYGLAKNRAYGVLGWVFFAVLAPTSLVPGNRQTAAEQRMYLALAAVVVGIVYGVDSLRRRVASARKVGSVPLLGAATIVFAAVLGVLTFRRNADYRSPVVLYGRDVAHQPHNAYAQTNYATALLEAKQYDAAIAHFEAALRLQPDLPDAEDNWGNALAALGRYPEAEAHYRHVIAVHPRFAAAYNNWADAALKTGQITQARAAAEEALRLQPDSGGAHDHLGLVLLQERRAPEAVNQLLLATKLEPASAEHWINYGVALRAARQPAAAAEALQRAASLEPERASAYYNWAGAEMDLHQPQRAAELLRQAIEREPTSAASHQNLGNALLAENQGDAAVAEYREAARLAPNDAVVRYNWGNALLKLGRRDEAVRELRRALEIDPDLQPARALVRALGAE